jgi:hypothetical protein
MAANTMAAQPTPTPHARPRAHTQRVGGRREGSLCAAPLSLTARCSGVWAGRGERARSPCCRPPPPPPRCSARRSLRVIWRSLSRGLRSQLPPPPPPPSGEGRRAERADLARRRGAGLSDAAAAPPLRAEPRRDGRGAAEVTPSPPSPRPRRRRPWPEAGGLGAERTLETLPRRRDGEGVDDAGGALATLGHTVRGGTCTTHPQCGAARPTRVGFDQQFSVKKPGRAQGGAGAGGS